MPMKGGTPPTIRLRAASIRDLTRQYDLFLSAEGDVFRRHGFPFAPGDRETFTSLYAHALKHDPSGCYVAEAADSVIAFVSALRRDDVWLLSALFVGPEWQNQGVGTQLLNLVWGEQSLRRIIITESIQPISNTIYLRRGLVPITTVVALRGVPTPDEPPVRLFRTPPTRDALRSLDQAAYGFDRSVDHAYWREQRSLSVWSRGEGPIAYSYRAAAGDIGPIAALDGAVAAAALQAELWEVAASGGEAVVRIAGDAIDVIQAGLACGLRLEPPISVLLTSAKDPPRTAQVLSGYFLM
jgi:GNAT superfamily N-acetyltransferase